jgi:hypothetical protein
MIRQCVVTMVSAMCTLPGCDQQTGEPAAQSNDMIHHVESEDGHVDLPRMLMKGQSGGWEFVDVAPLVVAAEAGDPDALANLRVLLDRDRAMLSVVVEHYPELMWPLIEDRLPDDLLHEHPMVRRSALIAANTSDPVRALPAARQLAADRSDNVRREACAILAQRGADHTECNLYESRCTESRNRSAFGAIYGWDVSSDYESNRPIWVEYVCPGSPASKQGMVPLSRIVSVGSQSVQNARHYLELLRESTDRVKIELQGPDGVSYQVDWTREAWD